jgi:hypothetical protein
VGQTVAKQFQTGLFIGKVERIEKKRGRCLYFIVYEDGDCEDLDEVEYEDAWFFFVKTQNSETTDPLLRDNTDSDMTCSDMEGSVYNNSDKEVISGDEDRPHSTSPSPRSKGHKRKRKKAQKVSDSICTIGFPHRLLVMPLLCLQISCLGSKMMLFVLPNRMA